jgi:outer membrane immunogenic protein
MLALGLFASTALCTSSFAADLAPVETSQVEVSSDWTGFYAGLEVGYAFADEAEYDYGIDFLNDVLDDYGLLNNDLDGLLGGVYGGFNYQTGNFVLGLEGSFAGAAIEGSSDADQPLFAGFGLTAETETEINWLATATGRVGYLVSDNFLLFAKGGAAFAEIEASGKLDGYFDPGFIPRITANLASISGSETALGFTVGAGGEYKFANNWSVKAEYNYVRFDDVDINGEFDILGLVDGEYEYSTDVDLHLVKVGVAYQF